MTTPGIPLLAIGIIIGLGSPALQAQEVIELPSGDRVIEPDFAAVYRVGVVEGESWEMFTRVSKVALTPRATSTCSIREAVRSTRSCGSWSSTAPARFSVSLAPQAMDRANSGFPPPTGSCATEPR